MKLNDFNRALDNNVIVYSIFCMINKDSKELLQIGEIAKRARTSVKIQGNLPCINCGYGDECRITGIKILFGPQSTVDSVGVNSLEAQQDAENTAKDLGGRWVLF